MSEVHATCTLLWLKDAALCKVAKSYAAAGLGVSGRGILYRERHSTLARRKRTEIGT